MKNRLEFILATTTVMFRIGPASAQTAGDSVTQVAMPENQTHSEARGQHLQVEKGLGRSVVKIEGLDTPDVHMLVTGHAVT